MILLLSLSAIPSAYGQCSVKAYSTSNEICAGDSLWLYAVGGCSVKLNEDFNSGVLPTNISTSGTPDFTNPCGPGTDGTTYLWMGPTSGAPRSVTSGQMNLSTGACQLCFDMRYAVDGGSSPCEGPDLANEGITLQYSVNNGVTWTDIQYWDPNGGNDSVRTRWETYCVSLPPGAATTQTRVRWIQKSSLPPVAGHWGLDNLKLFCSSNIAYSWSTGHSGPSTPWLHPNSNSIYTVTMTDLSTANTYTDTVSVKVKFTPSPNFTVLTPVCKYQASPITYTGNAGPSATFFWTFPAGVSGTGPGPHIGSWATTGSYDVSLKVSQGACTSVSESHEILVEPLVSFFIDIFSGCEPLTVNLTDNTTPTNSSFIWEFGDPGSGAANISTDPNPLHTFSTFGSFDLTSIVTTPNGCTDTFFIPDVINVYPNPLPDFDPVPPIAPLSFPIIQFNDQSQYADSWAWNFGDPGSGSNTSSLTSPNHTYGEGTFTVWLVASNVFGCTDSISKEVEIVDDILSFPNVFTPNGDGVNETFSIDNIESLVSVNLLIFNRYGQIVYQNSMYDNTFDADGLSDGIYYYICKYTSYFGQGENSGTITILRD